MSSKQQQTRKSSKKTKLPSDLATRFLQRLHRSVERKVLTTTVNQSMPAAGVIASLCNVPQGVDINDRISRHIRPLYVDYVITVFQNTATDDSLMVSIWMDKAAQSTTPVFSDVFDISTNNAGSALPNVTKTGSRYHALMIRDMASNQSGEGSFTIRGRVKVPDIDIEFYSSATAYPYNKAIFFAAGSCFSGDLSINSCFQFVFEDV